MFRNTMFKTFRNLSDAQAQFLINLCQEFKLLYKVEWVHKDTPDITFNFNPIDPENFKMSLSIAAPLRLLQFITFLCLKRTDHIRTLESCLDKELSQCA